MLYEQCIRGIGVQLTNNAAALSGTKSYAFLSIVYMRLHDSREGHRRVERRTSNIYLEASSEPADFIMAYILAAIIHSPYI